MFVLLPIPRQRGGGVYERKSEREREREREREKKECLQTLTKGRHKYI